jgi:hypothetical protein
MLKLKFGLLLGLVGGVFVMQMLLLMSFNASFFLLQCNDDHSDKQQDRPAEQRQYLHQRKKQGGELMMSFLNNSRSVKLLGLDKDTIPTSVQHHGSVRNDSSDATVMAMAQGYKLDVHRRFVGSLRKTGFKGTM